jgi:putative DNA primase/helicase
MSDIRGIFGGPFVPSSKQVDPPELQLADAMRSAGIDPPAKIEIDGQLHRFSTKGRSRDDSGWYIAFPDEPVAGRFGCWRDQIDAVFRAEIGRDLSPAEQMAIARRQSEAKAERDLARQRKAEIAASTVETIWRDAIGASPDHPYLKRKGIHPHGARLTGDGRLIVPLYGADGELASLQYISDDEKRYHQGGTTKSCSGRWARSRRGRYSWPRDTPRLRPSMKYPGGLALSPTPRTTCRELSASCARRTVRLRKS